MKIINNYKILFRLRLLKSILATFTDSFLVLYFLTLSDSNILPLGIYKIASMATIFFTIFFLRNICKSKARISLLRIGIILDLVYFLMIIVLKEKIIDYIYLMGILYGLEEGFYYSVFNMFESDGVTNDERTKYNGTFTATKALLSIIFPLIFGSIIAKKGFLNSIIIVLIIVLFRIALSFVFKDNNIPTQNKTDIKGFFKKTKDDKTIMQGYKMNVFNGLTYSGGAFQNIIMIYIIKIFSDSFSLGIFTSIFSFLTFLMGLLFSKYIKSKQYKHIVGISGIATIASLCVMILHCNMVTVVLFNFFQTILKDSTVLINDTSLANISNKTLLKTEYKTEYFLGLEFSLFIGRVISQSLFILMAFVNEIYIIPIFIIFLISFITNSIKLQTFMEESNNENKDDIEDVLINDNYTLV